jgi:hypothetical protein
LAEFITKLHFVSFSALIQIMRKNFTASGDGSYNQPSFFDSQMQKPPTTNNVDQSLSSMVGNMSLNQQAPYQYQQQAAPWQAPNQQPQWQMPTQQPAQPFGNPYAASGPFPPPSQ